MKSVYKVGDLVWAKTPNQPVTEWPARVEPQPEKPKKGQLYVYYFGAKSEDQYGWTPEEDVKPYNEETKEQLTESSKKSDFKQAVELIEAEYQKLQAEGNGDMDIEEPAIETPKKTLQPSKRRSTEIPPDSTGRSKSTRGKRKASSEAKEQNGAKQYKIAYVSDSIKESGKGTPNSDSHSADKVDFSTVALSAISEGPATKYILGFIGLGIMSTGMVKNLIKSGHKINLFSRDKDKCFELKDTIDKDGDNLLNVCQTPSDVMKASDIVFNCSSDPEAAKMIVTGNCGVCYRTDDEGLDRKGFVEMTGIDPQTSIEIGKAITDKGGRYLEAQLQGSRQESEDGTLIILAAGDNGLFLECQGCFEAIATASLYLGDTGLASKVYLILQLMKGISLVGLAEGLVLAERCGISGKDMVDIFKMTDMASPFLVEKANKIVNKEFKRPDLSIKNMQKDMRLALNLSDTLMQPLMMASAANEVYKHSRKLGYDDQDCSCIYMKARY